MTVLLTSLNLYRKPKTAQTKMQFTTFFTLLAAGYGVMA